jgi:hypothetical protein
MFEAAFETVVERTDHKPKSKSFRERHKSIQSHQQGSTTTWNGARTIIGSSPYVHVVMNTRRCGVQ